MINLLFICVKLVCELLTDEDVVDDFVEHELFVEDLEEGLPMNLTENCFEIELLKGSPLGYTRLETSDLY